MYKNLFLKYTVVATIFCILSGNLRAQVWVNGQAASGVIGQSNFTSSVAATSATGLYNPSMAIIDTATGKVYVCDQGNNRVLRFASINAATNGMAAEAVFGQSDFVSSSAGTGTAKMSNPEGICLDGLGNLWVADEINNRVLKFSGAATASSGAAASVVLGSTQGASQNEFFYPVSVYIKNNTLWVSDLGNNRVLRFNSASTLSNGATASGVFGQSSFTTATATSTQSGLTNPLQIFVDNNGSLWVADEGNNRVLRFDNAISASNGANADAVLGQNNFTSGSAPSLPSSSNLYHPAGVCVDAANHVYVSDEMNKRVLIYNNASALTNGASANNVLGQPDFTTNILSTSSTGLYIPFFNFFSGTQLLISDAVNNRIIVQTPQDTIYVDSAHITGIQDGISWATAYTTLRTALANVISGNTILVAKGTYYPTGIQNGVNRDSTFMINLGGIKLYGGYNASTGNRDIVTNPSIMSGDIGVIGDTSDNSIHVMLIGGIPATADSIIVDGFTIENGHAFTAGSFTYAGVGAVQTNYGGGAIITNCLNNQKTSIRNCSILNNAAVVAGGFSIINNSNINIKSCVFSGNVAGNGGGIQINGNSSPVIENSILNGNKGSGAGIENSTNAATRILNCTFSGNTSGSAIANYANSTVKVANSIIYGNANGISDFTGSVSTVTYSIVQNTFAGTGNLINVNPLFTNAPSYTTAPFVGGNYTLQPCSPAINAGDNDSIPVGVITDYANNNRVYNAVVDMGAYEHQGLRDGTSLALNTDQVTQNINPGTNAFIFTNTCRIIAQLTPNGGSPVAGSVSSEAYINATVQNYSGIPYVQRHFDITPTTGAATATAKVTLFVLQSEFDALNAASTVKLPTGPGDAAGIANLNIIQFHGISATGTPGTYSGGTAVIDPADADIIWNATLSRWEISFNVTGFSGFIIVPVGGTPLALNLLSFTGALVNDHSQLRWQTANEINTDHFEIDKSIDGTHFDSLTKVKAIGTGNNTYSTFDDQTQIGDNYYRLRSVDKDGSFSYSNIVLVQTNKGNVPFFVYPVPADKTITAEYDLSSANAIINVYNLDGQKVVSIPTNNQIKTPIDISHLAEGSYIIQYISDKVTLMSKFIKAN
jgi:hypothetical protein